MADCDLDEWLDSLYSATEVLRMVREMGYDEALEDLMEEHRAWVRDLEASEGREDWP